jgi:hypothetical protein
MCKIDRGYFFMTETLPLQSGLFDISEFINASLAQIFCQVIPVVKVRLLNPAH